LSDGFARAIAAGLSFTKISANLRGGGWFYGNSSGSRFLFGHVVDVSASEFAASRLVERWILVRTKSYGIASHHYFGVVELRIDGKITPADAQDPGATLICLRSGNLGGSRLIMPHRIKKLDLWPKTLSTRFDLPVTVLVTPEPYPLEKCGLSALKYCPPDTRGGSAVSAHGFASRASLHALIMPGSCLVAGKKPTYLADA